MPLRNAYKIELTLDPPFVENKYWRSFFVVANSMQEAIDRGLKEAAQVFRDNQTQDPEWREVRVSEAQRVLQA